jgi:hypothetical protein
MLPYAHSALRVAGSRPLRNGLAVAAAVLGLLSSAFVFFASFISSSFVPGLPWSEPCGLQVIAFIVPFSALPIIGTAQRLLADRAHIVGALGPYGIYSVLLLLAGLILGGYVGTALMLLWAVYGATLSIRVVFTVVQAQQIRSAA